MKNNKLIAKFMGFVYPMLKDIIVINNEVIDVKDIIKDIENRDSLDSSREYSPLEKADDAMVIDTSFLTIKEQVNKIINIINNKE